MKILLAEDDPHITLILQLSLERIGHHIVDTAANGEEALNKALTGVYDLILLDGMMPKMSGLQVLKNLHQQKPVHPPVILLSAKTDTREIADFLNIGDGHIQKPFDPETICMRIDTILAKSSRKAA